MNTSEDSSTDDVPIFDLISSFLGPSIAPNELVSKNEIKEDIPAGEEELKQQITHKPDGKGDAVEFDNHSHNVIVFTKDRPWQLQQLLRSCCLDKYKHDEKLHVFIIAKVTDKYVEGYRKIKHEYGRIIDSNQSLNITWLYESLLESETKKKRLFAELLEESCYFPYPVACRHEVNHYSKSLVMFLTDDCILLKPIKRIISSAKGILCESTKAKRVLGFCTRLHPGVTFCQTKNEASPPPRSHLHYDQTGDVFTYPMKLGKNDFSYPFDLSGGIYLKSTCISILNETKRFHQSDIVGDGNESGYSHPNKLEINGNNSILRLQRTDNALSQKDLLSIPSNPSLLILAINRVQCVCQAPLAVDISGENEIESYEPENLLVYLKRRSHLDLSRYRAKSFNSSHIGSVFIESPCAAVDEKHVSNNCFFALSVLIPVHNGPPSAAILALESILYQTLEDSCLIPMQIVLVDDRCEDGTIKCMVDAANIFAEKQTQDIAIRDYRQSSCHNSFISDYVTIDIVSSPSPGVGASLNVGLQRCEAEFIARMDADDVSCPDRLVTQLQNLIEHPSVVVLGTSCIVFSESNAIRNGRKITSDQISLPYLHQPVSEIPSYNLIRSSIAPVDAGFVAWSMMFSCVISHPSVVFRKSAIVNAGGYSESKDTSHTEDYDLWLRLTKRDVRSTCSLPMIGIFHRKHGIRNANDTKFERQQEESDQLSHLAMAHYCDSVVHMKLVKTVRRPDAADPILLDDAAEILCDLESGFISRNNTSLTKHEIDLITIDCNARIGELASLSVKNFGRDATNRSAWILWCERCPNLQMERIALLMHAAKNPST